MNSGAVEGSPFTWLVDPLDGTTNFLHRHPFYAASVAVWDQDGPVACTVDASALDTVWAAARGSGATQDEKPISVSATESLPRYLVGTGFPFKALDVVTPYVNQLGRVLANTSGVRRAGAAAIDLAYVANGILDAFWEHHLAPWDFGAGILLITEAGGVVERIDGGPVTANPGTVIAANSQAGLDRLRAVINGADPHKP